MGNGVGSYSDITVSVPTTALPSITFGASENGIWGDKTGWLNGGWMNGGWMVEWWLGNDVGWVAMVEVGNWKIAYDFDGRW